jgi:hypothetical protein
MSGEKCVATATNTQTHVYTHATHSTAIITAKNASVMTPELSEWCTFTTTYETAPTYACLIPANAAGYADE